MVSYYLVLLSFLLFLSVLGVHGNTRELVNNKDMNNGMYGQVHKDNIPEQRNERAEQIKRNKRTQDMFDHVRRTDKRWRRNERVQNTKEDEKNKETKKGKIKAKNSAIRGRRRKKKTDRRRKKKNKNKGRSKKKKKKKRVHPRKELKFDATCECGITKTQRIVNGQESGAGDWPWMVTLESASGLYYCGGSIISSRFVLTAAHCIQYKGEKVFVVIGDHDKNDDEEAVTKRIKGRAVPHKEYNPDTMENDVAIIRLNKEIDFSLYNGNVGPVCLAQKNDGDFENEDVTATGWGTLYSGGPQATVLMEVNLKTITNNQCQEDYLYPRENIKESMLCTVAPGKDACQGDSGGPLVTLAKDRGRYVQVGVVSWGIGCAEEDYPGVFARVTRLERWILNKAKKIGKFCSEDA